MAKLEKYNGSNILNRGEGESDLALEGSRG